MFISDLALDDFRSYKHLVLTLESGINTFIGANGQGKTNLVEALGYISNLTSHRAGIDHALVRQALPEEKQPQGAVVRVKVFCGMRANVAEVEIISGKANRARLNRASVRPRDLLGTLNTIIFAPEDLKLVRGEPGVRRKFLDELVISLKPRLASTYSEHDKILAQRASLLKSMRSKYNYKSGTEILEVWNEQLSNVAATIIAERVHIVELLRPWITESYNTISNNQSPVNLAYRSSLFSLEGIKDLDSRAAQIADSESGLDKEKELLDVSETTTRLLAVMNSIKERELERGANLVGAHRDDLNLFISHMLAKGFSSHGEQWSLALALRLASYEMLRNNVDVYSAEREPVLILDDVFTSLDKDRREALAKKISSAQQVLITGAVEDDIPTELNGTRFHVEKSEVKRV